MIINKETKIKIPEKFSAEYIEAELKKFDFDVLRWTITNHDEVYYTLNLSIVID